MKSALITGGNQGMGLLTAKELAKLGYSVTITARTDEKGQTAVKEIKEVAHPDARINYGIMDNNDLNSVKLFGRTYSEPIDVLILNAGIMKTPFAKTSEGFEQQYQVNHLAHFLLTSLLLPNLQRSSTTARCIFLSSRQHERQKEPIDYDLITSVTESNYDDWQSYAVSKLSNILTSKALAKRYPLEKSGVQFFSVNPGVVDTDLLTKGGLDKDGLPVKLFTPEEGIACTMYLATSTEVEGLSGEFFINLVDHFLKGGLDTPDHMTAIANDENEADRCWIKSLEFLNMTNEDFGKK